MTFYFNFQFCFRVPLRALIQSLKLFCVPHNFMRKEISAYIKTAYLTLHLFLPVVSVVLKYSAPPSPPTYTPLIWLIKNTHFCMFLLAIVHYTMVRGNLGEN